MAIKTQRTSVGTTATRLDQITGAQYQAVLVRNRSTSAVYLGGADVSTANGYQLDAGETISLDIQSDDGGLFGIVGSGTVTCHVLQRAR